MARRPRVRPFLEIVAQGTESLRWPAGVLLRGVPPVIVVSVALAMAAPQIASARWTRVSSAPSSTEPYFACPPRGRHPRCALIEDPIRGTSGSGQVHAGAITTGPELEVSPALYGNGVEGGYSPENLRAAYNLPSRSAGSGQTVAVVDAYDDPSAESDLKAYRSHYRLPECTSAGGCFRKVNQAGGSSSYPAPERTWAREISLDLDMVSAICPNCKILLVEADSESSADLAASEDEAATVGATEISNSFVGETPSEPPEYADAYDHPGIPITASGGDHGYGVESPASNPHVISVGGTTLVPASNSRGWTETVWYSGIVEGEASGTGSGCSKEPKPAWQTDTGCSYRTTNDVAAVADPNTPVSVYDSYEQPTPWRLIGGTSVGAPLIAAAMALANPYTRSFEGAQALYLEAAAGGEGLLNDIVSGSDGGCKSYLCEARVGYDGPSGLGSLDGTPEVLPPAPVTEGATKIAQTEATLNATVDPHGVEVDACAFEYGPTSSYGSTVPCASLPGAGLSPVPVSASVGGLAGGSVYHFRVTVGYHDGASSGSDVTLTTPGSPPPPAPTVTTLPPSEVTQSSATLNATVNPNGGFISKCEFEYGPTQSYGSTARCAQAPGSGEAPVAVSASIAGLTAGGTYHYRIAASNQGGTTEGKDQAFDALATAPSNPIEEIAPGDPPSKVVSPTEGSGPSTPKEPTIAVPGAKILGTSLTVSDSGSVILTLRCSTGKSACAGTITLRTLNAVSAVTNGHGDAKRILTLASGRFSVAGGQVARIRLRLSATARGLVVRSRSLRARATLVVEARDPPPNSQTIVTLRAPATAHGR